MSSYDDRLSEMLSKLKLFGIRDQLDSLLDEASRSDFDMRQTLTLLFEREIARKDARRIEMALKLAHFPMVRDLTGFDFAAQPSVDAFRGEVSSCNSCGVILSLIRLNRNHRFDRELWHWPQQPSATHQSRRRGNGGNRTSSAMLSTASEITQ